MSRHRILTIVASATLVLTLLAAPAPLSLAQPTAATTVEEPLPASATGKVRVVFTDAAAAGIEVAPDASHYKMVRVFAADPGTTTQESVRRWKKVPGVLSARPEIIYHPTADTYWSEQWDLKSGTTGTANAEGAWATTTGVDSVVVAVIDTGRTDHPDLEGAMPADWGYDMITSSFNADDGDGRDANPADVGDFDLTGPSDWHGTHVAGTIAAQHNDIGIKGIAPGISLMHVRVCGWLGCDDIDIVDAIRWASGLSVDSDGLAWSDSGIPVNTHPADVINLSLSGPGKCSGAINIVYRNAIAEARANGTVIVVSAGNDGKDAKNYMPASCPDVVTVAATGDSGARAYYSNYGTIVDLAAPGGDLRSGHGVLSTVNMGSEYLQPSNWGYAEYQGTSMAAPHVTGAVALLRSIWPNSTAAEVENELRLTARSFPGSCSSCGAGLLDIAALVSRTPQDTLTIDNDPIVTLGVGISSTLATEGGSGDGAVTLATSTPSFCSVRGLVVTGKKVGICTVTATKGRSTTNFPTTSAAVSFTVIAPPKVTRAPSVTLAIDKITVSVTDGTWTNGGTTSYAWYRCTSASRTVSCTPIDGETTSSYTVNRPTDIGYFIRAQVTMTNNGISVSAWSNATAKIVAL